MCWREPRWRGPVSHMTVTHLGNQKIVKQDESKTSPRSTDMQVECGVKSAIDGKKVGSNHGFQEERYQIL